MREKQALPGGLSRRHIGITVAIFVVAALILVAMDRPLICTCGTVKLWEGVVNGPGNSQHIADWYTPSHIIHGFIFYAAARWLMPRQPPGIWLTAASVVELAWEILENSPMIINRYREATMAVGYVGDSILNSIADGGWMVAGFLFAARAPWKVTLAIAIGFELLTLWLIHDNLALNVLMLVSPIDGIRAWQAGFSQPVL
jgi:Protein of unknown function (DUF2585)